MGTRRQTWRHTPPGPAARSLASPLAGLLAGLAAVVSLTAVADEAERRWWPSASGHFLVSYESRLEPIAINRLHQWVLTVTDATGEPVDGAHIRVSGGMPAHDHGLPTEPGVVEEVGEGRYLLDGMRFHMHGAWEIALKLEAGGKTDRVVIALEL